MSGIKDDSWVPEKKAEFGWNRSRTVSACMVKLRRPTRRHARADGDDKLEAINRCNIPVTLRESVFRSRRLDEN